MTATPFLRIPPFPGHRAPPLAQPASGEALAATDLSSLLRQARVGGTFWGAPATFWPPHPAPRQPAKSRDIWATLG